MKRVGNLIERIASLDNLQEAFLRAARGKNGKQAVVDFRRNLDENLLYMHSELLDGTFPFGQYHFFTVFDPKRRTICAASFPERVAFHALMRICHPVFDNYQIFDSYASRVGKGTYKALERAKSMAGKYRWFAKLDVCKYFDSISHEVLEGQLCRLFKDKQLLLHFGNIIYSYETLPCRGLPIGNLTSQYFANHYLSAADHHAKESLQVDGYMRYMDDILIFADNKERLKCEVRQLVSFIEGRLRLELHTPIINRTSFGIPFLGYIVYSEMLRLNLRSRRRFRCKMSELTDDLNANRISQEEYAMRATCLTAFVKKADSDDFIYNLTQTKGIYP